MSVTTPMKLILLGSLLWGCAAAPRNFDSPYFIECNGGCKRAGNPLGGFVVEDDDGYQCFCKVTPKPEAKNYDAEGPGGAFIPPG